MNQVTGGGGGSPSVTASRAGVFLLIGVFSILAGTQALMRPAFAGPDEPGHLGYVEVLLDGRLPTIDTPNPVGAGWEVSDDVWVANHPPLYYLLAAPPTAAGAGLMGLRVVSLTAGVIGLILVWLLAREVLDDPRAIVSAVGLAALCAQFVAMSGQAMTDSLAVALSAAFLLACARVLGGSTSHRLLGLLAAITAMSCLARSSLLITVPVAAACWVAVNGRRSGPGVGLIVAVATASSGWWYLRNVGLYGDPTGAAALLEKFDRDPAESPVAVITWPGWLVGAWQELWSSAEHTRMGSRAVHVGSPSTSPGRGLLVGGAVALATAMGWARRAGPSVKAKLLLGAWVALVVAGMARFVAGGGTPHARYLLPALPAIAVFAAAGMVRLHRWAPMIVIALVGTVSLLLTVRAVQ